MVRFARQLAASHSEQKMANEQDSKNTHKLEKDAPSFASIYHRPVGVYALAHSVGPLCKTATSQLNEHYLEPWQTTGGDAWPHWMSQIDRFRNALSVLLNTNSADICPQPSVSIAFSQWLAALAKRNKRKNSTKPPSPSSPKKVIMHKDAFASLGFAVKGLCETYHLELCLIDGSANDLSEWEAQLSQADAFACLLTHAHSNTGELSNIAQLSALAHAHNVWCGVDIAQSVGIIPIDITQWSVDCVVGSSVKWLSGGPGAAFLCLASEHAEELAPDHLAWFSHENPFEFDITHFAPAKGVTRFFGGTPSIAPFILAASAIEQHVSISTSVYREHNLMLMRHFLQELLQTSPQAIPAHYCDLLSKTPSRSSQNIACSGTLCLPLPANDTAQKLTQAGVKFDQREQLIRLSFSVINDVNDIEQVLSCL
ncbi:aminotransferase class V-fold PLP-dependent enzyme [Glaciecola siphonariae]|uniref:Aminotransferase class V-fold PLP-dependent enzyme n=1 Tax=Glaciecola siphonariae TaxID=521012 RepID=A0ABV9LSV9_9ALTE